MKGAKASFSISKGMIFSSFDVTNLSQLTH